MIHFIDIFLQSCRPQYHAAWVAGCDTHYKENNKCDTQHGRNEEQKPLNNISMHFDTYFLLCGFQVVRELCIRVEASFHPYTELVLVRTD